MTELLVNDFSETLKELAAEASEIKVLIAFLTEGGLDWLPLEKYPVSKFIAGLNLCITTPEALRMLKNGGAKVSVFSNEKPLFHPKAIYFKTPQGEFLVVGSNNLTSAGSKTNIELSLKVRRNGESEAAFFDFHKRYESLSNSNRCFEPNEKFFEEYQAMCIPVIDTDRFNSKKHGVRQKQILATNADPKELSSLGDYIREIAKEFPELDRKASTKIADHRLKVMNESEFFPFLKKIIHSCGGETMKVESTLNIGGNWRIAPLIEVLDEIHEPWEKAKSLGRLAVQIHFNDDFQSVSISAVFQYTTDTKNKSGDISKPIEIRLNKLMSQIKGYLGDATEMQDHFKVFRYKDFFLWAQPLLSYEHSINNLPSDEEFCREIESMIRALNELMLID
jgi:HKD family nuclease